MNNTQIAQKINDHSDLSFGEIQMRIKLMDADQLINLTAAVDDSDWDLTQELLDQVKTDSDTTPELSVGEVRDQLKKLGKNMGQDDGNMGEMWNLIGELTDSDWNLVSAQLDDDVLRALYKDATDQDVDEVSAQQKRKIHDHAQTYVAESIMVFENQLCEVQIPQAPEGLVGIRLQSLLKFVDRKQLTCLHEHVMGMTHMPVLSRVLELAGMGPANTSPQSDHMHVDTIHSPQLIRDHTQQLRRHIEQLEQLMDVSDPLVQEEIQMHADQLHRKAARLAHITRSDTK